MRFKGTPEISLDVRTRDEILSRYNNPTHNMRSVMRFTATCMTQVSGREHGPCEVLDFLYSLLPDTVCSVAGCTGVGIHGKCWYHIFSGE